MDYRVLLSYNNLWKTMVDKDMNKTQLKEQAKISTNAVAKMSKNKPVSLETIGKVCFALNCKIDEVIEIVIEREE